MREYLHLTRADPSPWLQLESRPHSLCCSAQPRCPGGVSATASVSRCGCSLKAKDKGRLICQAPRSDGPCPGDVSNDEEEVLKDLIAEGSHGF